VEKKRIEIVCANANCKEKFRIFNEEKGTLILYCPFCQTSQKVDFEQKNEHDIYRGLKV
jgi:Zn finger protein HypA/HybF involved in hydrogenase expression